jgi:hypothetical protein
MVRAVRVAQPASWTIVALLLAGCGTGTSVSPTAAVRRVARTYLDAAAHGDGRTACAQMTPQQQRGTTRNGAPTGAKTCPQVFDDVARKLTAKDRRELLNATITKVRVNGNTATAVVGGERTRFAKTHGVWLLTGTTS